MKLKNQNKKQNVFNSKGKKNYDIHILEDKMDKGISE